MTTTSASRFGGVTGLASALAVLLGLVVTAYGLLLLPLSALGGLWIAAIGLSLLLSGLFASPFVADRMDLSPAARRNLSVGFGLLAVVLLVAFAGINGMTVEYGERST